MTANELITNLSNTSLVGIKISDLTVAQNTTTLLALLNMAKNKIAEDTLLWLGGEQITLLTDTYEYTLSDIPIQIIDVYDDGLNLRPRNSSDYYGYFQTSPNKIRFNNVSNGTVVSINYYETPPDYAIDDTIVIPPSLLSAMQFYIAHKAFEIYKSESDMFSSAEYYKKYEKALAGYISKSDSTDVDSIVSADRIWKRGYK